MDFNYSKICANLLKELPPKMRDIVERRFGLKKNEKETLEVIGKSYNITRERVRQIEKEAFSKINLNNSDCVKVFQYFNNTIGFFGNVKEEKSLLNVLGDEKNINKVFFLLSLSDNFERFSDDEKTYSFWARDKKSVDLAEKVINLTFDQLKKEKKPFLLDELYLIQKNDIYKILGNNINKNIFNSYIEISKKIQKNNEKEIGLAGWVEINPKGIKDKAYLVLKKQGKSLHFRDVAELIENSPNFSQNKVHIATVHNELIKDVRFVLVGRGLYGLKEWGYEPGVVKDVILKVLKLAKNPLSKEEILEKVLAQRIVKENTIILNLQDRECFLRNENGKYAIKEN
ncbi:MAG: sigma factor-like helix-turn-helix DNA-binding protein [Candidatus Nealsonbacteria bacterium]